MGPSNNQTQGFKLGFSNPNKIGISFLVTGCEKMPPRVVIRGAAARRMKKSSNASPRNHEAAKEIVVKHEQKHVVQEEENNSVEDDVDEYEKDERLDLEDNYPEYEHEEYGGEEYADRGIEQDEDQEAGDEVVEDPEEDVSEESDTGDEEIEYVYEEVEEDDDSDADEHSEQAGEELEPAKMADAEEVVHCEVAKERRKRKEFEIFVGGLDKDATEADIRKVFSEVGVVIEVRLMMNRHTKKNKGFAFLRFETVEQATRAITELKNPVINGKQCGVAPSKNNDALFLGNICKTWTKEALKEKLKHYGVENVDDLTLVEDSNNKGMNRGFAFLEFSCRSDALVAFKRLQKRDVMFGVDKCANVSFADSFIEPGHAIVKEAKTVFIDPLPPSWDEDHVRNHLKKFGEIEKIELARNMPASRRKNYGFVTFGTLSAAAECVDSIMSAGLGEGDKGKVRAKLSRPHLRRHGTHVSRGADSSGRNPKRMIKSSQSRRTSRSLPVRGVREIGSKVSPVRPGRGRNKHPVMPVSERARPVAPPARSYKRRSTAPAYPKHSMKRDYSRREDLPPPSMKRDYGRHEDLPPPSMKRDYGRHLDLPPPRSRVSMDYDSGVASQRRPSHRDYPAQSPGYTESELPRSTTHAHSRRGYVDDGYGRRFERSPPPPPHLSNREGHPRDYDRLHDSKRPYTAIDDVPPRYADTSFRQSRARLDYDYDYGGSASQYANAYGDRLGRSSLGYDGSRSSISMQDTHGIYSSRQGMSYSGGSFGVTDSPGYGDDDFMFRGSDVGGSSYSLMYSGRDLGGSSSYIGGGRSRMWPCEAYAC
ncbi:hypothetical protein RIF29_29756 [Crotalaria pallida]|uniref:RRM domain-containing protein n=1 Tax=Crotalaria pallida TaxID=3830 RepID=A0AAN9HXQ8_CROPI